MLVYNFLYEIFCSCSLAVAREVIWTHLCKNVTSMSRAALLPNRGKFLRAPRPFVTLSGLCFQSVLARSFLVCRTCCLVHTLKQYGGVRSNFLGVIVSTKDFDREVVLENHLFKALST